jgi:hypothetical protein
MWFCFKLDRKDMSEANEDQSWRDPLASILAQSRTIPQSTFSVSSSFEATII